MKAVKKNTVTAIVNDEADSEPPSQDVKVQKPVLILRHRRLDLPISSLPRNFMQKYFPQATPEEWNNWQWQLRNSITTVEQLAAMIHLSEEELLPFREKTKLPLRITPYYASLIDPDNLHQPIRKTMVPVGTELIITPEEKADPLAEENMSPVPNLVHRYPDRVLFLVTGFCSSYCRYCTRSHMVSKKHKNHATRSEWDQAIEYIKFHTEVRDVVISGGDPLTLPDHRIEYLLHKLRQIKHVEIIRIGTKVPIVLPQRITPKLVRMMRRFHPLFMSIHCTHPDEITPETATACKRLADAGIPLGSQTVLLKGINDNVETFKMLVHELLKIRVRPYYLYQCDPIPGSSHFRTPVSKGLEIIRGLRGFTSGYAIPHFVIDAPGGGGKIPLLPEYVLGKDDQGYRLINYAGNAYLYPETNMAVTDIG